MLKRKQTLLLVFLLVWILLVLGGYYYYHKPIRLEMISAPFSAAVDLVFVALFSGLAGGLGRRLLKAEEIAPLPRAAMQFTLGASALALLWFGLGLVGAYRWPIALPLLLLGLALTFRDARAWFGEWRVLGSAWREANLLEMILAVLLGVLLFFQMGIALAPPIKWDALAYHLQLPRQYLDAGAFIFVPENPYWGHPQLVEMLYTFAMALHRAETAALLGWATGVIFLFGTAGLASAQLSRLQARETSLTAGWIAATAVMAGYTFRYLLGWSYTDLFSALAGLAALTAFFAWMDHRRPAWFLWASLFAGLAMGAKWTSGVLALGLFAAALLLRKQNPLPWKYWLLGGLVTSLVVMPWLVKNLVVTGSPIYPYFIGTQYVTAARISHDPLARMPVEWWQLALLPLAATWSGVDSAPGFSADLGPLLLLLAVPGFWVYRREHKAQVLLLLLAPAALAMLAASLGPVHLVQTRLYYVLLPCLALPAGWGWEWLQRQVMMGVRLRRLFSAVLLLVIGLVFWQDSYFMAQVTPLRVILGTQTGQSYLENTVGFHIRAVQAAAGLPEGSRTLMLWEPRGLYAPANAQADLWIDRWRNDRRELQSIPAVLARWEAEEFTHLLVYRPGVDLIGPQEGEQPTADWAVLQDLLAQLPAPTAIGDTYLLYSLE